jgi:hypothetical protein
MKQSSRIQHRMDFCTHKAEVKNEWVYTSEHFHAFLACRETAS